MIKYSIILPTYNRGHSIINALDGLLRQTIHPHIYEIIIIDDGSIDDTKLVVNRYKKKHTKWKIKYIPIPHSGPAVAKNVGVQHAKGNIVFFTDDDCVVPAVWMEKILEKFKKNTKIVGVGGWYRPPIEKLQKNIYIQFHYLLHRFYYGFALDSFSGNIRENKKGEDVFYPIITANAAYRKKVLQKVGGFDENFLYPAYEDLDLNKRIITVGYDLYYLQSDVLDNRELHFLSFLRLCGIRAKAQYVYKKYRLQDADDFIVYPWIRISQFSTFLRNNTQYISNKFVVDKRHILLSMLWFTYGYLIVTFFSFKDGWFFNNTSVAFKSSGVSISQASSSPKTLA